MKMDKEDKEKMIVAAVISGGFILLLFAAMIAETLFDLSLSQFGVYPRETKGLIGILLSPLIHADFSHLLSNTITLFFVFFGILYFYRTSAFRVFIIIYFFDGLLVWLFARPAYHIGASGLVYGFVSYLFFSGLIRGDRRSIALSLLMVFLYGGMIWGVLPLKDDVSFESHLFGGVLGLICAVIFRKTDLPPREEPEEEYEYDDSDDDIDPDEVKISEDATPRYF
jgi:membrane associated rhomboid family serine protease